MNTFTLRRSVITVGTDTGKVAESIRLGWPRHDIIDLYRYGTIDL